MHNYLSFEVVVILLVKTAILSKLESLAHPAMWRDRNIKKTNTVVVII